VSAIHQRRPPHRPGPLSPGFEWFVAWRHLRDLDRRGHRTLTAGIIVLVVGGGLFLAAHLLAKRMPPPDGFLHLRPSMLVENLRLAGIASMILGFLITYLGVLFASFTVFTAISIFGVFLGTALPIVTLSVMSGFETDLKTKIRGAKADVVISAAEDRPFTEWAEVRKTIATVPGVAASTPYLEGEVMLQSGSTPAGVVLRGIDPANAAAVLDLGRTLRDGKVDDLRYPERVGMPLRSKSPRPFAEVDDILPRKKAPALPPPVEDAPADEGDEAAPPPAEPIAAPAGPREILPAIILGEELYQRTLRVFVGSEVEVICPLCKTGPSGPMPGYKRFRVAGHFYSGMYEFDSKLAYVALDEAQRFLGMHGEVTGIDVRARTPEDAREVARLVQLKLGDKYDVRSWEELNKGLFMALRLEKIAMFVVLTFIALVASFSIVSTLIMSVTQKAREVAILKSMGASDAAIRRVFFAEGLYIAVLGLTVGVASGVLACKLIMRYGLPLPTDVYYISQLPVVMRTGEIVTVALLALLLCCLATVYPAVVASRLRPVEGLRYE
jgi:lipoprotein-releasing system permease protein